MADVPDLPNQIADELKAHREAFDLETAMWNGDVADLDRWPDYSAAGIADRTAALLDIGDRAEALPTTGTVERNLVDAVAFSAECPARPAAMLGRIMIDRIRADATARLDDRFDIRAFHEQVLATGSIPLDALRGTIEDWTEQQLARR